MKNRSLLLFALCAMLSSTAWGSSKSRIRTDSPDEMSTVFRVENKRYPGTQTVVLSLSEVKHCSELPGVSFHRIFRDGEEFLRLGRTDSLRKMSFVYSYIVVDGVLDPEIKTDIVYRMPCSAGKPIRVAGLPI